MLRRFALFLVVLISTNLAHAAPLVIGYSDWPGWVAWEVGIEKGCSKKLASTLDSNGSIMWRLWMHTRPGS